MSINDYGNNNGTLINDIQYQNFNVINFVN